MPDKSNENTPTSTKGEGESYWPWPKGPVEEIESMFRVMEFVLIKACQLPPEEDAFHLCVESDAE